ncbi:DUF4105 domain-containing protein (plasmid) [Cupriavidus sp. H18C2]
MRRRSTFWLLVIAFLVPCWAAGTELGNKDGPAPLNVAEISDFLGQDPYDLELLISFGTSKGGSAGHIALAIRDTASNEELVYSANFYADRDRRHEGKFHTADLIATIPKPEYLFHTTSSTSELAVFGLDFGETYKRSVVGVRVYGVPLQEKQALVRYFGRINDDYHERRRDTEYHAGEVKYDYLRLNCAKAIGAAFKYGAGYDGLVVKAPKVLSRRRVVAAATANIPTEMAIKLLAEWGSRGYGMDVVLYKKYEGSNYVEPREEPKIPFKDLPDRFPSVLSLDFRREQGAYRDFDNLFAMYLFYNLGRYSVRLNGSTQLLEIERSKQSMAYAAAVEHANRSARSDADNFRRHALFSPLGTRIGEAPDNTHLYRFGDAEKEFSSSQ